MSAIVIVTDSSSQLPPELAESLGVLVVPASVWLDGVDYLEGVDLDPDDFYCVIEEAAAAGSPSPELRTTQPTPARFVAAFEQAAALGAQHVVAVLVGSAYSGTVNAATVAAARATVPVHVVDSGAASFGIASCVLAAAAAAASGESVDNVVAAATDRAAVTQSVFILEGAELANQSARFASVGSEIEAADVAVLSSGPSGLDVIASVRTIDDAVDVMLERLTDEGRPLVAAVGHAGASTEAITGRFRAGLVSCTLVTDLLDYRVGPSIAVHTGVGTAGGFWWPEA